ncbi:LPS assembly lipoprotein LptE [uncultured Brevundimonas sp.]|uniref:LPS assembly lipoprotein LptE n=1 Tax=uncultured Brevundimonas sp. TaxID=213418 RepID=UPI0025F935B1|nr:LPS assembly lipoprotein LptE [uncultured Brevundimonas sp.]
MRIAAVFAVLTALGVSACGFTPIYAEPAVGSSLRRIAVSTQDDRLGYRLREQLEDVLAWDRGEAPLYRLTTQVEQSRRSLGRRIDDTATRYELTVKATWILTPAAGGAPITGAETVTTTYAAADQPYAAIAAQQDGEERAASELARLIRLDLMQALSNP